MNEFTRSIINRLNGSDILPQLEQALQVFIAEHDFEKHGKPSLPYALHTILQGWSPEYGTGSLWEGLLTEALNRADWQVVAYTVTKLVSVPPDFYIDRE